MNKILPLLMLTIMVFGGCTNSAPSIDTSTTSSTTKFSSDFFRIDKPAQDTVISSPLEISGQALGTVFFEGGFPISIEDSNGNTLGSDQASSTADWMTEKFVPFAAKITFKTPTSKTGFIVLKNDNPSGLPENSHSAKFPVNFK